jgi:hypothetical protein
LAPERSGGKGLASAVIMMSSVVNAGSVFGSRLLYTRLVKD